MRAPTVPLLAFLVATPPGAGEPRAPASGPLQVADAQAAEYTLPPGRIADRVRALAGLETAVERVPAWPAWAGPESADDPWAAEAPWRLWVELVRAERAAERPDPRRRARLALLARGQGRDADAWRHLLAAGESPEAVAVLPAFLPGVPVGRLPAGRVPARAEPGEPVRLSPALPPGADRAEDGPFRTLVGREMRVERFPLAGALLALTVRLEGDGVQVDLAHLEGPEVRVAVRLPVPPGVELGVVYADWERLDETDAPVELVLSTAVPTHELWGRFRSVDARWPAPRPRETGGGDPVRIPETLVIEMPSGGAGDPRHRARVERFAEALAELLERPAHLRSPGGAGGEGPLEPLVLHLGGVNGRAKLVAMIGLAEARALAEAESR